MIPFAEDAKLITERNTEDTVCSLFPDNSTRSVSKALEKLKNIYPSWEGNDKKVLVLPSEPTNGHRIPSRSIIKEYEELHKTYPFITIVLGRWSLMSPGTTHVASRMGIRREIIVGPDGPNIFVIDLSDILTYSNSITDPKTISEQLVVHNRILQGNGDSDSRVDFELISSTSNSNFVLAPLLSSGIVVFPKAKMVWVPFTSISPDNSEQDWVINLVISAALLMSTGNYSEASEYLVKGMSMMSEMSLQFILDGVVSRARPDKKQSDEDWQRLGEKLFTLVRKYSTYSLCRRFESDRKLTVDKIIKGMEAVKLKYPGSSLNSNIITLVYPNIMIGPVPMGDFKVRVVFPRAYAYEMVDIEFERTSRPPNAPDNIYSIHPHINVGKACFGTWHPLIDKAIMNMDLLELATTLEGFLRSYNVNTCYGDTQLGVFTRGLNLDLNKLPKTVINGVVVVGDVIIPNTQIVQPAEEVILAVEAGINEIGSEL